MLVLTITFVSSNDFFDCLDSTPSLCHSYESDENIFGTDPSGWDLKKKLYYWLHLDWKLGQDWKCLETCANHLRDTIWRHLLQFFCKDAHSNEQAGPIKIPFQSLRQELDRLFCPTLLEGKPCCLNPHWAPLVARSLFIFAPKPSWTRPLLQTKLFLSIRETLQI